MATQPEKPKSNAPLLIIGAVLVVALLGGWYLFSSSKTGGGNTNTIKNTNGTKPQQQISSLASAPKGADPPNAVGAPNAAVVIEEFADFQCPQCANAHPIMNEIKSAYGSRIRFIFRDFPLAIPAHDKSYDAAVAAEAAGMQGKFWDMQNQLFTNQKTWTSDPNFRTIWKDYATKIGLNIDKWETDMAGLAPKMRVNADMDRGKGANVNSTPTIFINGNEIPFAQVSVSGLKQIIDAELAKTASANK
jgi:protein-disulfide isomerase